MPAINLTKLSDKKNLLSSIGSVDNVIKGVVPDELKDRRFLAADFQFGFELGSPQGILNMGECILFNDLLYSSRTDATRAERDPLMWGPEFVTSGIFLVTKENEPNYQASYCSIDESLPLRDFYTRIYAHTGLPFAVAGCAELALLNSRSITYSPIEKENIFEHEDKYYTEDAHHDPHRSIAFVGVVSDFANSKEQQINDQLRKVLYYNPFNKQSGDLVSHTHAAVLSRPIVDIRDVHPGHVQDVIHLMDDSLIRYAKAAVFTIEDILPLQ